MAVCWLRQVILMRLGTGTTAAPGPLIWAAVPPGRRMTAVALLAMLAARAAASAEAVTVNAVMHPEGLPQLKIRPEHLALAAIVYVRQSTRGQVLENGRRGCSMRSPGGRSRWAGPGPRSS